MGKAAMCIRMLQILNTGRIYKISELAELLETSPRNIIEYKKELNEVATDSGYQFYIRNVPGRYGGYVLDGNAVIPSLKLNKNEKDALVFSHLYLSKRKDFTNKRDYENAYSKVVSNINIQDKTEDLSIVDKTPLLIKDERLNEIYDFIKRAIEEKNRIRVRYRALIEGERDFLLDPYELFVYNNAWYFLAWCYEQGDVCYFKLNRIMAFENTGKKYQVWKMFNSHDYIDEHGFKKFGETIRVKLRAANAMAILFKERIYGLNQTSRELEDGSLEVELDLRKNISTVLTALSWGEEVTILEPRWLVEQMKETLEGMMKKYE